jgi:hypothetical protein
MSHYPCKNCSSDKICNPVSGKCVLKSGKIGNRLSRKNKKTFHSSNNKNRTRKMSSGKSEKSNSGGAAPVRSEFAREHAWLAKIHPKKYAYPYPNLYNFVQENILPDKLSNIDKVVKLYVDLILENLKHYDDLNQLIYGISPFPGWIDSGSSNVLNAATEQLEATDLVKDLKSALNKDGIKIPSRADE